MKVSFSSAIGAGWGKRFAKAWQGVGATLRGQLASSAVAALLLASPMAQAQVQNGGFETGDFSSWTLRDYNRGDSTLPVTSSAQLGLTPTGTTSVGGNGAAFRSSVLTGAGVAANTDNKLKYPFSGNSSAKVGDQGGLKGSSIEQVATMALSDVDPVDGKVHIRFAMAPVLNNPAHPANQQPFFFVEVINQTKGATLFTTFNYSNQPGIPWQSIGSYQFTDWQGFDISPGNGLLDVGDNVLLKIYVANCAQGAATHTGQVYVDVFGSKMPGLSVYATGPAITKPGEQITYKYNYVNNSGVLAIDSWVRLAAPITENGLHLTFVPGSYPAGCTGIHTGTPPRADYIDCPVGDLNDGAGGNFNVTFTVPSGAATTSPNNVINNGDYDIRASTVSPFIGPLVKTVILPSATPTVDLGISVSNGGVPSYAVGGAVTYTITVTNNGPIDVTGASITQTLSGITGTPAWTCAPAGGSSATCGAASGSGPITTTGNLPVGQSLVYTVNGITATAAGTNVVTVVNVAPPAGTSDSVAANNTDGLSTPVSAEQHTLTVNTTGAGTGLVNAVPSSLACASPGGAACNSQLLGKDQEAYLTAVADPGSVFKNWTGDCTTITGNQCYVKMGTVDLSVTAVFAKAWTVTPSISGGTMTPNTPQQVEDGQGTSFVITPGTPGHVPTITTPGGANTCPGVLTGPDGSGNYTYTVSPVTANCAFNVAFAAPAPKLNIVKAGPATAHQGIAYNYTLTVSNTGTAITSAAATVTDTLPAALIFNPASSSSDCSAAGQVVTCTVPAGLSHVAPGNTAVFTINVTPNPAVAAGNVVNTASVSGGGDPACPVGTPCDSNPVTTQVQALSIDPVNDSAQTPFGTPVTTVVGANDTATNGTVGAITGKTDGANGAVVCTGTGVTASCTYTPNAGFTGTDSYTYTICLEAPYASICKTATVDVVVGPNAVNDNTSTMQDTPVSDTVVTNDTYPAGSTFTSTGVPVGGTVTMNSDGSYAFTPTTGFTGAASFQYTVCLPSPNDAVCDTATVTITVAAPPNISIVKSVMAGGPYSVGSAINYSFLVTNTGGVQLTGVVVNDALLDAPAVCVTTTLVPGANTTCTGSHTVTAAEVAAGYVHNSATASGTPPTIPGNPAPAPITTSPSTVDAATVQNPAMTMVKSVTSTGQYVAGDVIAYAFLVTNTGNVNLSGIAITDALLDAPAVCPTTTLAPGANTTCTGSHTVTAADVAAGYVHNSATAGGTPPTVPGKPAPTPITTPPSTVDTATVQNPAMTIAKSVTSTGVYTAGSVIQYAFLVTNTGNVTLSGVSVNDALLDAPAVCPVTTLAPGASTTCTGSHTVTAADVEAGNVHNVATASGTPPTVPGGATPDPITSEPSEVNTAIAQHPSISTVKTATLTVDNATQGAANIGDVITYAIVVTNIGDVTLNNLVVSDTMDGYAATTLTCAPLTLAPGASAVCDSYSHTVTVADANRPSGNLDNRVEATAWTLSGSGSSVSISVTAMGNAAVLVEPDPVQIRLVKTATPRKVKVGDLVRYTLTLQNTGTTPLVNGRVMDTPPAGFTYVAGSLAVNDQDGAGQLLGTYPLSVGQIDVQAGQTATITYLLRVGAGVRAGVHTNNALINDDGGERVSNVATADVELTADPLLDESLVVGTVFDDRDSDGWQDSAALSKVQVQGGFSPSAYVAGSTTVDRGQGAQPEADASAPMLHGIAVGALRGRDSDADLASNHRVVISQTLSALDFTDDFVLTSAEGVTLRMDAAGKMAVTAEGKAAKGLTSATPTVTRKISQVANGYQVDYIIENEGVDERGIPGVRIATVEGLLVETDQYGRYHLTGVDGGRWERGRNFIMKVDAATLPPSTSFTTENPKLRRVTPGLPVRFDFGVKLPNGVIEGGQHAVEMELGEVLFAPESAVLRDAYLPIIDKMAEQVRANGAGEVVISANGATQALAMERAKAVREALVAKLDNDLAKATTVTLRADLADPSSTLVSLGESPVLGTILFDTDKATIKPAYVAVIDKIAADIEALGGGVVGVIGHADRRGSDAYNLKLGLRRAKAVYEAIAAKLSAETKAKLRVEINDDPSASVGLKSR